MIKRIYADNYKTFVNFTSNFDSINILLGKNGCGKSNLFTLVFLLRSFILGEKRIGELFTRKTLTRWQNVFLQTFELEIEQDSHCYVYHLEIDYDPEQDRNRVSKELLLCDEHPIFKSEKGTVRLYNDAFAEGPEMLVNWELSGISLIHEGKDNKLLWTFKKAIENIIVCMPLPYLFTTRTDREALTPDYHFSNFTAVYRFMQQRYPERIYELWKVMQDINPNFLNSALSGTENEKFLQLVFKTKGQSISYSFDECSDGEKTLFALYFLLICYKGTGAVLLLDEPENTVTLPEIQPWLQMLEDCSLEDMQCIVISHHPEILDYLASSYGIWMDRAEYGMTKIVNHPISPEPLTVSEYIARGWNDE